MSWPKPWRTFRVPIYGGMVYVFRDLPKLARARVYLTGAAAHLRPSDGCAAALEDRKGYRVYLIGWFDGHFSTLAHECGHTALNVLEAAGIDPRESSGEALCYLQGELMSLTLGRLDQALKRRRR